MIFEFKWPDDAAPLRASGVESPRAGMVRFVRCPDSRAANALRESFDRRLASDAADQGRPAPEGRVSMRLARSEDEQRQTKRWLEMTIPQLEAEVARLRGEEE